ncbi:metal-dependent transcriptional regulator [Aureibaculum sp. A20]|uniref:Transcriptional regulator MntR n=1 Tax=Aureibaculum flavum TaxID=2795986 RepID=A0ABS0WW11_9FLAO|nr:MULTISPECIES: metal-dependent transcriptional regulator [Aureibaculum]MBJ2176138.1 metal-dependent transcriptional regulator [Aureibaculum flavum]
MLSSSEENYLKSIYHLELLEPKGVSTNAIAKKMNTKASSVTDMVQKLSDKKLVVYKKYQGVQLSKEGKGIAVYLVRKHRLWECFLVDKLDFAWDEVHEIAEQLEHIKSDDLVDKLDEFLDFPTIDPHGDPIPDKDGNITKREKIQLSYLEVNQESTLLGVKDSSDEFLRYLDKNEIAIGQKITVLAKEPFDNSLTIKVGKKEMLISQKAAHNLYLIKK